MAKLELEENVGWILILEKEEKPPIKCIVCRKALKLPYYYCKDYTNGRCRECEIDFRTITCPSREDDHVHFNIIQIKNEA